MYQRHTYGDGDGGGGGGCGGGGDGDLLPICYDTA